MRIENEMGTINISNEALAAASANIARSCFGVRAMTAKSPLDGLVHLLKREAQTDGVKIRTDEDGGICIILHIAVNYGVNIQAICKSIVEEIKYNLKQLTGVDIKAVDIYVDAVKA